VIIVLFNAHRLTRIPLQGLFLEVPVNISVSYFCIVGVWIFPELGVAGAAWGSLVAILVRTVYLSVRLRRSDIAVSVSELFLIKINAIKHHLTEAGPIAANYVTLSLGMMVFQLLFARLPVAEYAAIVLVLPWLRMGGQVSTAWAQATSIHIGQLVGRGEETQTQRFVRQAFRVTIIVALVLSFLYIGYAVGLPFIYPNQTENVIELIKTLAPAYVLLTLFRTVNTTCGQALRAFGDSGFVLLTHASTQWLAAIPLCALLLYWQVPVVWVFGMLLLEEVLKTVPFVRRLQLRLSQGVAG
jgi:Na+-driven multidrug efflux pump